MMPPVNGDVYASSALLASTLLRRLTATRGITPSARPVIGIAGESGSGKSVTALALVSALREAGYHPAVLHQDDYFLRPPRTNHEYRLLDLAHVGPHEVDLRRLASHIAAFRARERQVPLPRVDYPGNRFDTEVTDFGDSDVLVVEGTYVLQLADLDARIFLCATHEDTAERRRVRARDVDAPVMNDILSIEHALISPQAKRADIVIDRDFRIADSA